MVDALRTFVLLFVADLCFSGIGLAQTGHKPVTATVRVSTAQLTSKVLSSNWLSYNGDYTGRRYSGLTQITPYNVNRLHAQWVFHNRSVGAFEVTPVVVNGVMYITASNDAYALNAETGNVLWHYSRPVSTGLVDDASDHHTRGVALLGFRLFMETDNAHLLCLDARSGHLLWDVAYAAWNKNYGATSAPLVVKDNVLVGTSGGDDGVRGFIAAYNAVTGKLAWRFWTIPGPGEAGASSWPGEMYLRGGGTAWMPGTYDPSLNTIYWGTGNAAPDFDGSVRPGDDLYTASLIALDPDTGKLKWYFQFTPHDVFDYDGVETPVLVDAPYKGGHRKLIIEANRNGFIYILDRTNGKFLSATRFAKRLNWAAGIDAAGRPIRTGIEPTGKGTEICPGYAGATNWFSPSYSELTHMFYFLSFENCNIYYKKPQPFEEGKEYYSTGVKHVPGEVAQKFLLAFDPQTNSFAWRYSQVGPSHSWGGVMTTSTGLLFFADDADSLEAVSQKSGKPLWHFNAGQASHASPMSYAVNGTQYVAMAFGNDLFSFALYGN